MCISHLLSRKRARVNLFQNYKSKHNQVAIHGVLQFNKLQQHQWLGHLLHMELLPFLCNAGMVSFLFLCKHHITLCFLFTSSIFLPKICNSVHSTVPENAFLIHTMSGSELLLFRLLSCTRKPSIPCTEALVFAHLLHRAPELNRPIGTFASHFQGHVKEVFFPFLYCKAKDSDSLGQST